MGSYKYIFGKKEWKKTERHEESPVTAKAAMSAAGNGEAPRVAEGDGSEGERSEGLAQGGAEPREGVGEGLGPAVKRRKREQTKPKKEQETNMAALEFMAESLVKELVMEQSGAGSNFKYLLIYQARVVKPSPLPLRFDGRDGLVCVPELASISEKFYFLRVEINSFLGEMYTQISQSPPEYHT